MVFAVEGTLLSSSEFTDAELPGPLSSLPHIADAPHEDETAEESSPPPREGLPRGFRMRHDTHYVDQLDGASPAAVLRMLPLGGIDAPACADGPAIEALARSIRRVGIVEPLVVRRSAGRYQVIAGAKRLSAARLAQLERVPCVVRDDLAEDALGTAATAAAAPSGSTSGRGVRSPRLRGSARSTKRSAPSTRQGRPWN